MKTPLSEVGFRIHVLREARQQTQAQLAMECRRYGFQVTRQKIAHYERGRCEVPARLIPVLALALNDDITALLPPLTRTAASQSNQKLSKTKNVTGFQIRTLRMKLKWSQYKLANVIHEMGFTITRSIIANLETGRSPVTDFHLVVIAKALGVPPMRLFQDASSDINISSEIILQPTHVRNRKAPNYEDRKGNSQMVTGESWQALHSSVD